MRLFVAVQLSDEMKKSIGETMHELKKKGVKGNYVPLQNLHLTLAFIGETDDPKAVRAALENVKVKPFKVSLSDMGTFGDLLWVGVKGNQGLSAAAKAVREALESVFEPLREMEREMRSLENRMAEQAEDPEKRTIVLPR